MSTKKHSPEAYLLGNILGRDPAEFEGPSDRTKTEQLLELADATADHMARLSPERRQWFARFVGIEDTTDPEQCAVDVFHRLRAMHEKFFGRGGAENSGPN